MSTKYVYTKTEILPVLLIIEKEYNKIYYITTHRNGELMKSYAKIAIIAIAGWLEDGLKELAQLSIIKLREINNQEKATKSVGQIHSFTYKNHISQAIIISFGVHCLEYIEAQVGDTDIAKLSSSLGKLKIWRDEVAHSHRTAIPCNPTQIIRELNIILPILKKIEKYARVYRKKHFS